jgi:para-nitrobenzyl esterase
LSEEAGVADVRALRALPVDALLGAQERTVAAALAKVGMMPFHPWIDHDLLDAAPWRGPLAPVALVVGTNAHEMELFRDQVPVLPEDVAVAFLARKAGALGITGEARVRRGLDACGGDLTEAVADLDLHVPNELLARSHRAAGNDVWRSRFTWEAPGRRACHALDLPFTFGTLDVDGWRDFAGAHDPAADALSARMRRAFAAFARDGAPGDAGTAPWPRTVVVHLGARPGFGDDVVAGRVAVWLGER